MVTLEEFLDEEVNQPVKDLIMNDLDKIKGKEQHELIFNRYSLNFFPQRDKVIIYDDVFFEEQPLELTISTFSEQIRKHH